MSEILFLPQGDFIRQLLLGGSISDYRIIQLLRSKGVFLDNTDRNYSIPLLMKTIVSAEDYHYLLEKQKSREDKVKYRTASIKCDSDFSLLDVVGGSDLDINKFINDSSPYQQMFKVKGSPSFYLENPDTAVLDYELERENVLSNFNSKQTIHNGKIILKKTDDNGIQLVLQQNITAKETHTVNELVIKSLKKKLHDHKLIRQDSDFARIKFSDFSNKNRIHFLLSFINIACVYLKFLSISDVDLYLDTKVETHKDLKKFLHEIENLKLSGVALQDHVILKTPAYYPKLILSMIKLKHDLDYKGLKGRCDLTLSFPEYISKTKDLSSELQITLDVQLDTEFRSYKNQKVISKDIFNILERIKITQFNRFKT